MRVFKDTALLTLLIITGFAGLAVSCPPPSVAIDVQSPGKFIGDVIYARAGTVTFKGTANHEGDTVMDSFTWTIYNEDDTVDGSEVDTNTANAEYSGTFTENIYRIVLSAVNNGSAPGTAQYYVHIIPAGNIWVPRDFDTIQDAIDFAENGETIVVSEGTYVENIDFKGKDITLTSTNPDDPALVANTVIVGDGLDSAVSFDGTESASCQLLGFTVTSGLSDQGLVAHWTLDDGSGTFANDSAANHDGTLTGFSGDDSQWVSGHVGSGALQFDGVDDYIEVDNASEFDITNQITVSAWFKADAAGKFCQTIISKGGLGSDAWRLYQDSDNNALKFSCPGLLNSVGIPYLSGTINVFDGYWHHAVGVYDGQNIYLYIDGRLDNSASLSGEIPVNSHNILIGEDGANVGRQWDGAIDDVRVYNRALEGTEIAWMFAQNPTGPVAHWEFDSELGTTPPTTAEIINGNDAELKTGASIVSDGGLIGGALAIDGTVTGYAEIPDEAGNPTGILNSTKQMSLSFWGYRKSSGGLGVFKYSYCPSVLQSRAYYVNYWDTEIMFRVNSDASTNDTLRIPYTMPLNTWQHIAVTFDNGKAAIYVDGKIITSKTMSVSTIANDTNSLFIGGLWHYCTPEFLPSTNSLVDDLKIYDRPLTALEVKRVYQVDASGIYGNGTEATISKCVITGNTAENGGGIYDCDGEITNCTITGNTATKNGGGIFNRVVDECQTHMSASVSPVSFPEPVLYWKLNGGTGSTAPDSAGTNAGTLNFTGDPVWTTGYIDGALQFDGDDYVKIETASGFDFAPGSFSVSAWVNGLEVTGSWRAIMEYDRYNHSGCSSWFGCWLSSDGRFHFRVGSTTKNSNTILNVNEWYLVTAVFDADSQMLKLYINGQLDATQAFTASQYYSASRESELTIATYNDETGEYFDGMIDDVRIYNRALEDPEIASMFAQNATDEGLVAHWKFNSTVSDSSSGASNIGQLCGNPELVAEGRIGGALKLDGQNDYVEVPFVLNPSTSHLSAFVWVKGGTTYDKIFAQEHSDGTSTMWLQTNKYGYLACLLNTENSSHLVSNYNGHTDGDWHHIGVVWNNDSKRRYIYVDGNIIASDPEEGLGASLKPYTGKMHIGVDMALTDVTFWDGLMDDVRIYNQALTEAQVHYLFKMKSDNLIPAPTGPYDCSSKISSCTITGNASAENGGGIANYNGDILNCVVAKNTSGNNGGGIFNKDAANAPIITNCTIADNSAAGSGGGISNDNSTPFVKNSILWGNTDVNGSNETSQIYGPGSASYSCVQNGIEGDGNIDTNPLFADTSIDYSLAWNSPCIDAGDNTVVTFSYDIKLNPRKRNVITVVDTGIGSAPVVDMGAYEVDGITGKVVYVDASAADGGDGTSWVDAYDTLQEAITSALANDVVLVAEGTYSGSGNRDLDFGGKAITVRSTDPDDWTVVANTVIQCGGSVSEPHRGFYFHSGEGNDSVVSGFTITGGYGDLGSTYPDSYSGGAVLCENSSPTISNCLITSNACQIPPEIQDPENYYADGGGIACYDGSDAKIIKCIITDNSAKWRGGISAWESIPTINNCLVANNTAESTAGIGGDESGIVITNCTIFNNDTSITSSSPAGVEVYYSSNTRVTNCILWDNSNNGVDNRDSQIKIYSHLRMDLSYCCIEGWTPPANWEAEGCFGDNPNFANITDLDGPDDIWGTDDDGLQLLTGSHCIDAADGDKAPVTDILNKTRKDMTGYSGGTGSPDYVDIGAYEISSGPYNSRTLETFVTIQDSIASSSTVNGDIIIIPEGTYSGSGNRDLDFGGKAITVRSTDPDDWKVVANTVIQCGGSVSEPHRGFYFHSGEGNDSVVSGFTITGGYGDLGSAYPDSYSGGAVLCENSSPTISNCLITSNACQIPPEIQDPENYYADGGGIACYDGSDAKIIKCIITDNSAKSRGGISAWESIPTINNCLVANNTAESAAGIGGDMSGIVITNCTIFNNDTSVTSSSPAGVEVYYSSNTRVTNCILWDNSNNGVDNRDSQIKIYSHLRMDLSYCCIEGWTPPANWEAEGCFGDNPNFANITDLDGPDDIWGTDDDGLQLLIGSPCIDAGDGDFAPLTDITGRQRLDLTYLSDKKTDSTSNITYADLGAHESYADTDSDGLADEWEKLHWPDDDLSAHDSTTNSDTDSFNDRMEYLFGLDPKSDDPPFSNSEIGFYNGGNIYAPVTKGSARLINTISMPKKADYFDMEISLDFCMNKDCDIDVSFKRTDQSSWSNAVRTIHFPGVMMGEVCTVTWDGIRDDNKLADKYFYDIRVVDVTNPSVPKELWVSDSGDNSVPGILSESYDFDDFNPYKNIQPDFTCELSDYAKCTFTIDEYKYNDSTSQYQFERTIRTLCNGEMLIPGKNYPYWSGLDNNNDLYAGLENLDIMLQANYGTPSPVRKGAAIVYYEPFVSDLKCSPYRIISSGDEITTIQYKLAYCGNVTVEVYDSADNLFATLLTSEYQDNGSHSLKWNGRNDTGQCIFNDGLCRIVVKVDGTDEMLDGTITVYK